MALCTWGNRGDYPGPEREGSLLWLNNTESFCKVQRCPGRSYYIQPFSLGDLITPPIVQSPKLCPTLCHLMNCSTLGFPVLHSPRVCSNSCPLSPVIPCKHLMLCHRFSSCPQSFPASGSFLVSQLIASGGQNIGASASASASVLPVSIQGLFPLGLTGLISLMSKGLSRVFFSTTVHAFPVQAPN